jgi:hypothetical protein
VAGGLSFLAEMLARRAAADPQLCETVNGGTPAPARAGAVPSTVAPSGKEAPKQESGIGQFFQGLFGK